MDADEKWKTVRAFYEKSYKRKNGLPILFEKRPSDASVDFLYDQMRRLGMTLGDFYASDQGLLNKLEALKGLKPEADPLKKRGPWD